MKKIVFFMVWSACAVNAYAEIEARVPVDGMYCTVDNALGMAEDARVSSGSVDNALGMAEGARVSSGSVDNALGMAEDARVYVGSVDNGLGVQKSVKTADEKGKCDVYLDQKNVYFDVCPDGTWSLVIESSQKKEVIYRYIREFQMTHDPLYGQRKLLEDKENWKLIFQAAIPVTCICKDPNGNGRDAGGNEYSFKYKGVLISTVTIDCKDGRFRVKGGEPKCTYTKYFFSTAGTSVLTKEINESYAWMRQDPGEMLDMDYSIGLTEWLTPMRTYIEEQAKEEDF